MISIVKHPIHNLHTRYAKLAKNASTTAVF
jgi:hypothetical protein